MKSTLKIIRNIIFYGGLYYLLQFVCVITYGIYYAATNFENYYDNQLFMDNCSTAIMSKIFDITLVSALLTLGIYALVLMKKERNLWKRCNFKKISKKTTFKVVMITIGASAFTGAMVAIVQDKFPSYNKINEAVSSASYSIFSLMAVIILLPIFEEILFRGLIFNELNKKMSLLVAAIVQGVLFGIYHMNILQSIYAAILGIILGLIYIWTKSIVASIVSHITFNLLGTIIMPLGLTINENIKYFYIIGGLAILGISLYSLYSDFKVPKKEYQ